MENINGDSLSRLPIEMLRFTLRHLEQSQPCARLGELVTQGRQPIYTPHYVVPTSRGVVPHLSHDMLRKHTGIAAAYIGLEDFVEKSSREAPLFKTPVSAKESALRRYIALPENIWSIFGPRRVPAIPCPAQNTSSAVSVSTSVGFRPLLFEDYIDAIKRLVPDINLSLADLVASDRISVKRVEKSADRTHAWLRDTIGAEDNPSKASALFASIPPIEKEQQAFYLADLRGDFKPHLSGLNLYSPSTVAAIPDSLHNLPRLCLMNPASPQEILFAVAAGVDLITTPLITQTSEHGMAFSFTFSPPQTVSLPAPLAFDLWSTSHATSLEPLTLGCPCYTCSRHHRAYIHHLLRAKEMLAWTLLQIHNSAVLDAFFARIRDSIANGKFDQDREEFSRSYEKLMPDQTGQGPRVRGYQVKSVGGGELKKNPKAYGRLDDQLQKSAEVKEGVARSEEPATNLKEQGFAQKLI